MVAQLANVAAKRLSPTKLVPHSSLHVSQPVWWLESRFHFSFADYFDPARSSFGALRVLNDDLVKPEAGFGTHPHRDAEIFSYVVDGELSHADSMGNAESLGRGCVQYLSAGTGIAHSEMNQGAETTRFLQIWFNPDRRGHTPQYGSSTYSAKDRHNKLLHILGGTTGAPQWPGAQEGDGTRLHADANVFVSESDAGVRHELTLGQDRQAYVVCIEGDMSVNGQPMTLHDGLQVLGDSSEATRLEVEATGGKGAHFMVLEMARDAQKAR